MEIQYFESYFCLPKVLNQVVSYYHFETSYIPALHFITKSQGDRGILNWQDGLPGSFQVESKNEPLMKGGTVGP